MKVQVMMQTWLCEKHTKEFPYKVKYELLYAGVVPCQVSSCSNEAVYELIVEIELDEVLKAQARENNS